MKVRILLVLSLFPLIINKFYLNIEIQQILNLTIKTTEKLGLLCFKVKKDKLHKQKMSNLK
jgi:hypothetical protein